MIRLKEAIFAIAIVLAAWASIVHPAGMTPDQGITFGIVLITLALWGTGLVPGYVASTFLFVALILTGLFAPQDVFASFSSTAIWLVVAGFVIGAAITHSGLGARVGALAGTHLSKSYAALIGGLMILGMMLGFVMPSSLELAQTAGFSVKTVLMTQVIGFSTILFPYQIGPLIVAMGLAGENPRHLLKITLFLFAIAISVLLPLDYLWWALLGKF
jgi:di/tricarboxylate transporter